MVELGLDSKQTYSREDIPKHEAITSWQCIELHLELDNYEGQGCLLSGIRVSKASFVSVSPFL